MNSTLNWRFLNLVWAKTYRKNCTVKWWMEGLKICIFNVGNCRSHFLASNGRRYINVTWFIN